MAGAAPAHWRGCGRGRGFPGGPSNRAAACECEARFPPLRPLSVAVPRPPSFPPTPSRHIWAATAAAPNRHLPSPRPGLSRPPRSPRGAEARDGRPAPRRPAPRRRGPTRGHSGPRAAEAGGDCSRAAAMPAGRETPQGALPPGRCPGPWLGMLAPPGRQGFGRAQRGCHTGRKLGLSAPAGFQALFSKKRRGKGEGEGGAENNKKTTLPKHTAALRMCRTTPFHSPKLGLQVYRQVLDSNLTQSILSLQSLFQPVSALFRSIGSPSNSALDQQVKPSTITDQQVLPED